MWFNFNQFTLMTQAFLENIRLLNKQYNCGLIADLGKKLNLS